MLRRYVRTWMSDDFLYIMFMPSHTFIYDHIHILRSPLGKGRAPPYVITPHVYQVYQSCAAYDEKEGQTTRIPSVQPMY